MTVSIILPEDSTDTTVASPSYSFANVTVNNSITSSAGLTYTTGTGYQWANTAANPWLGNGITSDPNGVGKLKLTGEGADVEINGVSLSNTLKKLCERLNVLEPNEKLEAEWDQLRELGDQYRKLEAKLTEQGEMWAKLKAMPPPELK